MHYYTLNNDIYLDHILVNFLVKSGHPNLQRTSYFQVMYLQRNSYLQVLYLRRTPYLQVQYLHITSS